MSVILVAQSALNDHYQTTVPETVRCALGLGKRDKIQYSIRPSGDVVMTRVKASEDNDPVLGQFLAFLAHDFTNHRESFQGVDTGLVERLKTPVGDIDVDLDAALSADDE